MMVWISKVYVLLTLILVGDKFGRMGRYNVLHPGCPLILELDVFCRTHRGE